LWIDTTGIRRIGIFGHKKGSFTGATENRIGYFEAANGGTLFLDEIGELPLSAQVKLLRAIQESKINRIGESKPIDINVRIIAATNRSLIENVASGTFREDLFHRLAVGVLYLPPLRDRHGDLNLIIDHILESINKKFEERPGWKHKNISVSARNLMHQHPWPGNIRELYNTISRATILNPGEAIESDDIQEALFPISTMKKDQAMILNRNLGNGFSLPNLIAEVAVHYLQRAVAESKGNKTKIATLVGLSNYQTVTNWMKKYGLE